MLLLSCSDVCYRVIIKSDRTVCHGKGLCFLSALLVSTEEMQPKHLMLLLLYIKGFPLVSHRKALFEKGNADI